jgi:hypothetical protein
MARRSNLGDNEASRWAKTKPERPTRPAVVLSCSIPGLGGETKAMQVGMDWSLSHWAHSIDGPAVHQRRKTDT